MESLFDTCHDFLSLKSVEVPTVAFHFLEGKALSLSTKSYLIPMDSTRTYYFAFAPTKSALSTIGNVQ